MDRVLVYTGAIPEADDILRTNKNMLEALGYALRMIIGTGTWFDGLACTATGPASMNVLVAPGSCIAYGNIDATAYGDLGSDTTHQTAKQGISRDTQTIAIAAPGTVGQSINYLIQGAYQDQDTDSVVLPYYNASNPAVAFNGPSNSGTSQNTTRKGRCIISLKAGTAATTGTQVTPAPDAGFSGLWVVTVANGATSITSGNISQYPGAPFLQYKLPDINGVTALPRTALAANANYYVDPSTGSDLTGTGAIGSKWQTIQHAIDYIAKSVDLAGFSAVINCASGAYAPFSVTKRFVGGDVFVVGDITTPSNCNINTTSADCITVDGGGCTLYVKGFKLTSTNNNGVVAQNGGRAIVNGNMEYGAVGSAAAHLIAGFGGEIVVTANYTISGGCRAHLSSQNSGIIDVRGVTATMSGSPAFSTGYFWNQVLGLAYAIGYSASESGSGPAYALAANGVLQMGGAGFTFTGASAGSTATGGIIV